LFDESKKRAENNPLRATERFRKKTPAKTGLILAGDSWTGVRLADSRPV